LQNKKNSTLLTWVGPWISLWTTSLEHYIG